MAAGRFAQPKKRKRDESKKKERKPRKKKTAKNVEPPAEKSSEKLSDEWMDNILNYPPDETRSEKEKQMDKTIADIFNVEQVEEPKNGEPFKKKYKRVSTIMYVEPEGKMVNGAKIPQKRLANVMYVEPPDNDNLLYCEECQKEYEEECPVHGAHIFIHDTKVEEDDPDRALNSLPPNLSVRESNIEDAGLGVFTDTEIESRTMFGPYHGEFLTDPAIANTSGYCWQISRFCSVHSYQVIYRWICLFKTFPTIYHMTGLDKSEPRYKRDILNSRISVYKDGKPNHFIDAKDVATSNWMRYVNCAQSEADLNLVALQYQGGIYYLSIKPILPDEELLVWYGGGNTKKIGADGSDPSKQVEIEPLFNCEVCGKSFYQRSTFNNHMKEHIEVKPYECKLCDKSFYQRSCLDTHMRIHARDTPYKCHVCDKVFMQSYDLNAHFRIHTGEKPYVCKICGKAFNVSSSLRRHSRIHTGEKPYKCNVCEKAFNQSEALNRHLRIHTGERPFKCKVCGQSFNQSPNLYTHIKRHTKEIRFKCDICDKAFHLVSAFEAHMSTHEGETPFQCKVCDKEFKYSSYLTAHMRRSHVAEKPYKCKECGKDFIKPSAFDKHMRKHRSDAEASDTTEETTASTTSTSEPQQQPVFTCIVCDEDFETSAEMFKHMTVHAEDEPFECKVCGKTFKSSDESVSHMKIHSDEKLAPNVDEAGEMSDLTE